MSYILDALKRAERERKQGQGQVSVLDEIPNTPVAEPRRRLPPQLIVPIAGFVVLVILVYAGMAWRRHAPSSAPPQPPVAAAPPVAVPPPRAPAVVQPPPPPPQAPTATIEDGGKLATLDDIQAPSPPPGTPPTASPPGDAGPQITAPHGLPPAAALQTPQPAAPQKPPAATQAKAAAADVQPDQAGAVSEPTPQETSPSVAQDQIPAGRRQLQEMPESFRANFPTFTVDVHAYNIDPGRRFVLINGKRYHEGDTLAEGPRIIGIVPEGIVFDWQGQQVLYAIAH